MHDFIKREHNLLFITRVGMDEGRFCGHTHNRIISWILWTAVFSFLLTVPALSEILLTRVHSGLTDKKMLFVSSQLTICNPILIQFMKFKGFYC
jgi:hypothetical protein